VAGISDNFKSGQKFRVKKDFVRPPFTIVKGEILKYMDAKENLFGDNPLLRFTASDGSTKVFTLDRDDPSEKYNDFFQRVGLFG
jgi:hypothetical protein